MKLFAGSLCMGFGLLLILNGSEPAILTTGIAFLIAGIGLIKRQNWAGYLGAVACTVVLTYFGWQIWRMTGGGMGRQMGLAGGPIVMMSLVGTVITLITMFVIWRAMKAIRKPPTDE